MGLSPKVISFLLTSYSGIISDLQNVEEIVQRIPLTSFKVLWLFQSWLLSKLRVLWPPIEICGTQKGRQPVVTGPPSAQQGQWEPTMSGSEAASGRQALASAVWGACGANDDAIHLGLEIVLFSFP